MIKNSILIWVLTLVGIPVICISVLLAIWGSQTLIIDIIFTVGIMLVLMPLAALISGILAACGKMNIFASLVVAIISSVIFISIIEYIFGGDKNLQIAWINTPLYIRFLGVSSSTLLPTLVGYGATRLIRFIGRRWLRRS